MNWLDLLITVCLAIGLIKGLFDGIVKQVVSIISLAVAIFFAGVVAKPIREFCSKQSFITSTFPDYVITSICYILAFVAIILLLYWAGRLVNTAINVTPAKGINHLLGGALGALKWVLILSLVFILLIVFDPNCKVISKQIQQESVLFRRISSVVPSLYPYVKNYLDMKKIVPLEEEKQELPLNEDVIQV